MGGISEEGGVWDGELCEDRLKCVDVGQGWHYRMFSIVWGWVS